MRVLEVRNVHDALPRAIRLLLQTGVERSSRNSATLGDVLQSPVPVTTVYTHPWERVLFHHDRDANPFFHLYEMIWMLAGRNDVAGPAYYAGNMKLFSDDGTTFHGAYGHRWINHFGLNQLPPIIDALKKDPTDRRCVLQMWDATQDLGRSGKDFPCNTIATVQVSPHGKLDLVVFCRSNDIVWGAYGANAVHFSFLQEYLARKVGRPIGLYSQVSVNWHGYRKTLTPLLNLVPDEAGYVANPYAERGVIPTQLDVEDNWMLDRILKDLMAVADLPQHAAKPVPSDMTLSRFYRVARSMFVAHHLFREKENAHRIENALAVIQVAEETDRRADWLVAGREWLMRRANR